MPLSSVIFHKKTIKHIYSISASKKRLSHSTQRDHTANKKDYRREKNEGKNKGSKWTKNVSNNQKLSTFGCASILFLPVGLS
ncbi:hypothetical protein [Candidatus Electrothrix sp.]|uniref:hypothetical protein n=1 Tax=Candidatus Electrothrix sp. TaxID=2170559 RepID=UPI004057BC0D